MSEIIDLLIKNGSCFIEGNIKVTETYAAPILGKCINAKDLRGQKMQINLIDDNSCSIVDFFKKSHQEHKIKTIINPALETLIKIRNERFDLVFIYLVMTISIIRLISLLAGYCI